MDGNTDGSFFNGSVTATNLEANPWWQVDLGASTTVSSVVVWNRTDCCGVAPRRLLGVRLRYAVPGHRYSGDAAESRGNLRQPSDAGPSPSTTIPVGAPGRYVRVQLSGTDYLSLAEVQVFGQ